MQDVHPIGGGGGDRRLRPNPHHHQTAELKCPRCDSLNTKFCYYNNYNLSQPRHFCKSCRRYWTKGGVLRNVPVGGGSRKTKQSKQKTAESQRPESNSHSSSESSSITAAAAAAVGAATTEVAAESANDQPLVDHSTDGQIFQELGSFTSLMTSSDDPSLVEFTNAAADTFRLLNSAKAQWGPQPKMDGEDGKMQEITAAGFFDDATQSRRINSELSPLDWQIGGGQGHGLFDLTGAVDQSYWNDDHTLNYLP